MQPRLVGGGVGVWGRSNLPQKSPTVLYESKFGLPQSKIPGDWDASQIIFQKNMFLLCYIIIKTNLFSTWFSHQTLNLQVRTRAGPKLPIGKPIRIREEVQSE